MTKEEALKYINNMWMSQETHDALEVLIPEFGMSEDERISLSLIEYHRKLYEKNRNDETAPFHRDAINWLEKHKECLADNSKTSTDDDERIRKSLIKFLTEIKEISESGRTTWAVRKEDLEMCKSSIAYLEKRKEENWNKKPCLTCQEYEKGHKQGYTEGCTAGYNKAMKEIEQEEEGGYEEIPVESTLEYRLGFKAGKESEEQKPEQYDIDVLEKHITKDSISELAHTVIVLNGWEIVEKEQKPAIMKTHKGDNGNPYDMGASEAQDYAINRGFGIPFNDGEVFVDERYIIQTIGNILRWADEHPKVSFSCCHENGVERTDEDDAMLKGLRASIQGWQPTSLRDKLTKWLDAIPERLKKTELSYDQKNQYYKQGLENGIKLGRDGMYKEMYCDGVDGIVYRYDKYSYVKEASMDELSEKLNKFNHGEKVKMIVLPIKDQK